MTIPLRHINIRDIRLSPAWLIILLGILIRVPLLATPITWQADIWRQTDTAAIARHFLTEGFNLLYPQVYWGGAGPGYVETEFQLYPFIVAILYRLLGEHVWLGRLVSLLFSIPTIILFWHLVQRLLPPRSALIALGFFVLTPIYIRYSLAFMPEAAVMFFYVLALVLFQRWLDEARSKWLLLTALSTALAILVKPTSIHIGLIFAVLALRRFGWRVLMQPSTWLAIAIALLPGVAWYTHAANLYKTYGNTFGVISGGDDKFGTLAMRLSTGWYISVFQFLQWLIFTLPGLLLFVMGCALAFKRKQNAMMLMGVITNGLYLFTVARYATIAANYYVYLAPFAAMSVAIALDWLLGRWRWVGIALAALIAVWMMYYSSDMFRFALRPFEVPLEACGKLINQVTPPNTLVSISTDERALGPDGKPNNFQEPVVFFFADRHGLSLPPEWHTREKLEEQRQAGVQYFVVHDDKSLENSPSLVSYLNANATLLTANQPGMCQIYQLRKSPK